MLDAKPRKKKIILARAGLPNAEKVKKVARFFNIDKMKRISHGKDKLEPRQKKTAGFFIFAQLITAFAKSFKTNIAQVHLEYIVIALVVASITLVSASALYQELNRTEPVDDPGIIEAAFRAVACRILGTCGAQASNTYLVHIEYYHDGGFLNDFDKRMSPGGGNNWCSRGFERWSSYSGTYQYCTRDWLTCLWRTLPAGVIDSSWTYEVRWAVLEAPAGAVGYPAVGTFNVKFRTLWCSDCGPCF